MLAPFHTSVNCVADLEAIFYSVFVCWILKKSRNTIETWLEITNPPTKGKKINTIDPNEIYGHMQTWMRMEETDGNKPWIYNGGIWIYVNHITWEKVNLAMSKKCGIYENGIYQNDEKGFAWICNFSDLPLYNFKECEKRRIQRDQKQEDIWENASFWAANSPSHL
jgi:hypothetical protein